MILSRFLKKRTPGPSALVQARATVVINTLNRRDHLAQVLDSLHEQSFKDFEVIVVNGPSVDGTEDMLRQRRDEFHVVPCNIANLGVSRNLGVRAASCEVIAFIDDDAIPHGDWVSHIVSHFGNPQVAAVGGPVFDIPTNRVEWKICTCTRLGEVATDSEPPVSRYLGRGADPFVYLAGCNMAFNRGIVVDVGGFDERLKYGYDDVDICAKVVDSGRVVIYDEKITVNHLRAPSSVRNDKQQIVDPYDLGFSRALFARTYGVDGHSIQVIEASLKTWVEHWVGGQTENADYFEQRLTLGVSDALEAASHSAQRATFPDAQRLPFLKFR